MSQGFYLCVKNPHASETVVLKHCHTHLIYFTCIRTSATWSEERKVKSLHRPARENRTIRQRISLPATDPEPYAKATKRSFHFAPVHGIGFENIWFGLQIYRDLFFSTVSSGFALKALDAIPSS